MVEFACSDPLDAPSRPADRGEAVTDEEVQIRERDRHYRKSPGVAVYAPDDRRTLLRLLDEARAERDAAYEALRWVYGHWSASAGSDWYAPPAVAAVLEKVRQSGI